MKDRPILFSAPMVRAILAGRKTVTRRVMKPHPNHVERRDGEWLDVWEQEISGEGARSVEYEARERVIRCPYGVPGDRLWVRETWGYFGGDEYLYQHSRAAVGYRADHLDHLPIPGGRWRPSIHMPRWASRLTLDVVSVRVERVQEIRCHDIRAEGVACPEHDFPGGFCVSECRSLRRAFADLWDSINAARGFGWDANPWVFRVEFRRLP